MEISSGRHVPKIGWVLYDGSCYLCRSTVARFGPLLLRRGFQVLPLQDPAVSRQLNLPPDQLLREMRVLTRDGQVLGGAAALLNLARLFWWARPLCWLARVPFMRHVMARAYAWIAARRNCISGACSAAHIPEPWTALRLAAALTPFFVLPIAATWILQSAPAWLLMWALAGGIWLALKWATVLDAWRVGLRPSPRRSLAYMLACPNTDALTFLDSKQSPGKPLHRDWFAPVLNTCFGLALLYIGVRLTYPVSTLLSGWIGMIGLILVLHFGGFQLLALLWRRAGINATPIMRSPLRAVSLAGFWGRRWNTGFSEPAKRYLHGPLAKHVGAVGATACVFVVSGLLHEIVISVPARAGFGLPTAYFLLQSLALQIERSEVGRRLGLGRGFVGWAFAFVVTAGPAFLLFHPPFVREVILPFVEAIGALKGVAL